MEVRQELSSVEAVFDCYDSGKFYFVDMDGTTLEFHYMEPHAREKYDLIEGNSMGSLFMVVYRVETEIYKDEKGVEYEFHENIIVDLEMIG